MFLWTQGMELVKQTTLSTLLQKISKMLVKKIIGNLKVYILKLFSYTEGITCYQSEPNIIFLKWNTLYFISNLDFSAL